MARLSQTSSSVVRAHVEQVRSRVTAGSGLGTPRTGHSHSQFSIPKFAPAMLLVTVASCFVVSLPLVSVLRIGPDEDYELAKAALSLKGYRLYTEVWNDQPPLHTFAIVQILKHI